MGVSLQQTHLLTVSEVASWLNISRGWVHDHASGRRQPILPSLKLGKSIRFSQEDVSAWLKNLSDERPPGYRA